MKYLLFLLTLSCSTPDRMPLPPAPPDATDTYEAPLEAGPVGDERYEGLAPPGCSGPAAGCGNLWCFPNCGLPGQPGGTGGGGALPQ